MKSTFLSWPRILIWVSFFSPVPWNATRDVLQSNDTWDIWSNYSPGISIYIAVLCVCCLHTFRTKEYCSLCKLCRWLKIQSNHNSHRSLDLMFLACMILTESMWMGQNFICRENKCNNLISSECKNKMYFKQYRGQSAHVCLKWGDHLQVAVHHTEMKTQQHPGFFAQELEEMKTGKKHRLRQWYGKLSLSPQRHLLSGNLMRVWPHWWLSCRHPKGPVPPIAQNGAFGRGY